MVHHSDPTVKIVDEPSASLVKDAAMRKYLRGYISERIERLNEAGS